MTELTELSWREKSREFWAGLIRFTGFLTKEFDKKDETPGAAGSSLSACSCLKSACLPILLILLILSKNLPKKFR
jgi:hypothetical protein